MFIFFLAIFDNFFTLPTPHYQSIVATKIEFLHGIFTFIFILLILILYSISLRCSYYYIHTSPLLFVIFFTMFSILYPYSPPTHTPPLSYIPPLTHTPTIVCTMLDVTTIVSQSFKSIYRQFNFFYT